MTNVKELTHDEIADWAALRLRTMGYPLSFSNMTSKTCREQPDVLGLNDISKSIVVEVKVSRADFLKDKHKPWRKEGQGFGKRRVYLTPKDLLKPEEIPYGWELWEVHGKNKPMLKIIKGKKTSQKKVDGRKYTEAVVDFLHCDVKEYLHFSRKHNYSYKQESMWMIKILRRMESQGFPVFDYANGKKMVYENEKYKKKKT
jgi:hypothetical protein